MNTEKKTPLCLCKTTFYTLNYVILRHFNYIGVFFKLSDSTYLGDVYVCCV